MSVDLTFTPTSTSNMGWAPVGVRPVATVPTQRGVNVSLLLLVSFTGDLVWWLVKGSVNGVRLEKLEKFFTLLYSRILSQVGEVAGRYAYFVAGQCTFSP